VATTEVIGTQFSSGDAPEEHAPAGIGPYALAWRRLRRNRTALAFGGLFGLVVLACLLAPVYAKHVAHTTPSANHLTDQVRVGGELRDVVSVQGIPIGPTWHGRFFLGADANGRDVAVRLLTAGATRPRSRPSRRSSR
jgi:peptide/nickel transport system permease protein